MYIIGENIHIISPKVKKALAEKDAEFFKKSAIQQVEQEFKIPVVAIATLCDLIEYLKQQPDQERNLERMRAYRERYGIK